MTRYTEYVIIKPYTQNPFGSKGFKINLLYLQKYKKYDIILKSRVKMSYKSSTRAKNRYIKRKYDRITITVYKGKKSTLKIAAYKSGKSLAAYIKSALKEQYRADTGEEIKL